MNGFVDLPLFYLPNIAIEAVLTDGEASHCIRTLRARVGDRVLVTDGQGKLYLAEITSIARQQCSLSIIEALTWHKPWHGEITLAVAPTKSSDRIEWLVEKAVEIGVDHLVMLRVQHSERKHISVDRLERIMLSAMKQSQKAILPTIQVDLSLEQALQQAQGLKLVAHCRSGSGILEPRLPDCVYTRLQDVALFIGPEGDFSLQELEQAAVAGAYGLSLGESRLRTETAGLVALQWIHTLQQMQR